MKKNMEHVIVRRCVIKAGVKCIEDSEKVLMWKANYKFVFDTQPK